MAAIVVLVDGRNVQRSRWPNVPSEELVERVHEWAEEEGLDAEIVFDGRAPAGSLGTAGATADDWIASRAEELAADGARYWLVTSDRGLKRRAGGAAERTIGGGGFLSELGLR